MVVPDIFHCSCPPRWRGKNIGIVFQFFQLIPTLTIMENILLAMDFVGSIPKNNRKLRARMLLEEVDIFPHADKLPTTAKIYGLFIGEGMVAGFIGVVNGLIISLPMSSLVSDFFGNLILETPLGFSFNHWGCVITVIVTFSFFSYDDTFIRENPTTLDVQCSFLKTS